MRRAAKQARESNTTAPFVNAASTLKMGQKSARATRGVYVIQVAVQNVQLNRQAIHVATPCPTPSQLARSETNLRYVASEHHQQHPIGVTCSFGCTKLHLHMRNVIQNNTQCD